MIKRSQVMADLENNVLVTNRNQSVPKCCFRFMYRDEIENTYINLKICKSIVYQLIAVKNVCNHVPSLELKLFSDNAVILTSNQIWTLVSYLSHSKVSEKLALFSWFNRENYFDNFFY